MNVGVGASTAVGAAITERVAELLALLDQSGVVSVANVESLPEGKVGYDLRLLPESRAASSAVPSRLGDVLQVVARVADLVVQGRAAGLVLRQVIVGDVPLPRGRAEVAALGTLLRTMLPKGQGPLPPVLDSIIRRAIDAEAPDRYQSVAALRGDLVKLQQAIPASTNGATVALTRMSQLLTMMEFPDVITPTNVGHLPDGRTGYGLRLLPDGTVELPLAMRGQSEVTTLVARLSDAVVQGREAGMTLREVTSRGVTLMLVGADGRAELTALGTILRDLVGMTQTTPTPPLAAMIQRALDPEARERFDEVADLRDELVRYEQAARLVPLPPRPPRVEQGSSQWVWWFVGVAVVLAFAALLLR